MFTVLLLHKKDVQALLIVNEQMIQRWLSVLCITGILQMNANRPAFSCCL